MKFSLPLEVLDTDVAIIGSGGAGLMCLLHLQRADPSLDITLISKGIIGRSGCTVMVQGGYNAVLDPADSLEAHFADTLNSGNYLNHQKLAWSLVTDAPKIIYELETEVGCFFDHCEDGSLHLKGIAGQTFNRTVHRRDLTGLELMGRLRDQVFRLQPRQLEEVRALDFLFDHQGELAGVILLHMRTGHLSVLRTRVIVMATGGAATMYKFAAPAREKTSDGLAMCYRAGLGLRDMEMMQFHPTGLLAGSSHLTGSVLEEGLRGVGAYLYNASGERYMQRYDPERMERSTRDVVARAGYLEIIEGRGTAAGGVWIDISHLGSAEVERQFPGMVARTRLIGRDLAREPVEVAPTAHFHMGGVIIDEQCQTSLPGLLVAGEDAGGVHGANRLGGNGVAESTVFGARAGDIAASLARQRSHHVPVAQQIQDVVERTFRPLNSKDGEDPFVLAKRLKEIMWEHCGVVRNQRGLLYGLECLENVADLATTCSVSGSLPLNAAWQEALDLTNQITIARLIILSALEREESRGAHFRSDYPQRDDHKWLQYIVMRKDAHDCPTIVLNPVEFSHIKPDTHL